MLCERESVEGGNNSRPSEWGGIPRKSPFLSILPRAATLTFWKDSFSTSFSASSPLFFSSLFFSTVVCPKSVAMAELAILAATVDTVAVS